MKKFKRNLFLKEIQINASELGFWVILNPLNGSFFATAFEGVRLERSLILVLTLTYRDILKESEFTDHETNKMKNLALEKLHEQRMFKVYTALQFLETYFFY